MTATAAGPRAGAAPSPPAADALVVGIDIGGTKIAGALLDASLRVLHSARLPTPPRQAEIIELLTAMVGSLAMRADRAVHAVGIGVPSMVERPGGRVVLSINTDLGGVLLGDELARRTGRRVLVDNDGNLAALAEHCAGAARGTRHSVTLTLGTGVGGGVIVDDALVRGGRGTGAELGHVVVDPGGPPCLGRCPGRGCLEAYASGTAVHRAALARTPLRDLPDAAAVAALADAGDPDAVAVFAGAGRALGVAMTTMANVFGPEVFVIGGGMAGASAHLLPHAEEVLRRRALPPNAGARLVTASFGGDAGLIGAALMALHEPA